MNITRSIIYALLMTALAFTSCQKDQTGSKSKSKEKISKIFTPLSVGDSGIDFANNLKEDSTINYFTYPYIYMGGGVAVGDVNNDGLQDLYFSGNMVKNRLYLNKGNLKFEDITVIAGVGSDDRWMTGVTMADVNADGLMDIYASVSGKFTTTKNQLFINQGVNSDGIPTFSDEADKRGVADIGRSTNGTFFDYDKDGDLDLYVTNYPGTGFKTPTYSYSIFMTQKDPVKSDNLYQNDGTGQFTNVTAESGLTNFGLSLSATVGDFDQNGWQDIYVSNDFASPDHFYFNNGDGTFTDRVKEVTQHTAFFGMGTDVADFNNDGLLDILQMDMTPGDNRRNKANMASMDIAGFWEIVNYGMHYQYMQNALQLNNGLDDKGKPHFSDVSRIAGISTTDWSWAGLLADLDNDGWKDIFITNGTRRDINNKDYFDKIEKAHYNEKKNFTNLDLTLNMPFQKVDNYAYKNNGDLSFTAATKDWGLSFEGFSNGASYADLDNDGDLEVIINNIDAPALVFENSAAQKDGGNYLRINLEGNKKNINGLGAKVTIKHGEQMQYQELTRTRGFQSSVEPVLHFGLGAEMSVDQLTVVWPDGNTEVITDVAANQVMTIKNSDATGNNIISNREIVPLFSNYTKESGVEFTHKENPFDDYLYEILLPHKYSQNGSGIAVGDVNGDGLEDFYIGGAGGQSSALYVQTSNEKFVTSEQEAFSSDPNFESMGSTFFDADMDGDLDLYVISGGNEYMEGAPKLQDIFYLNDGKGNFSKTSDVLPSMLTSGSRVKEGDYDGDGDMDLFVGGRLIPRKYPLPAKSYILKNEWKETGKLSFTDVTSDIAPELEKAGLVTDALWSDYDADGKLDLVIVGEWMPITFMQNTGSKFENRTKSYGLKKSAGWWYSISAGDFDNDGDVDYMAGNLGLNYKYQANENESFDVYARDYDHNGKLDIVLGYYDGGVQYPLRGKQCSAEQIPAIKIKYDDYNTFAEASLEDVYTKQDLKNSDHYQAWTFASSYIENLGDEGFSMHSLPNEVQLSSVNSIIIDDVNNDGHLDALLAGNLYSSEVETPRNDASYGKLLLGNGKGNFKPTTATESGIFIIGDTKEIAKINTPSGYLIAAMNNNDKFEIIRKN